MARKVKTQEEIRAEMAQIKAAIALMKKAKEGGNEDEQRAAVEQAEAIVSKNKTIITEERPKARREVITPANEAPIAHVKGERCQIVSRHVRCRKCDYKFFSGESMVYNSNVAGRVISVCPSCLTDNLIKSEPLFALVKDDD
ncbi:MAG: hypothetical protein PHX51_08325 [Clostridia bacterium]|nr:hypothetical protein [Clostridia bacterium]